MPVAEVQVNIPYSTGLPEDVAVNTWYFTSDDPIATFGPGAVQALAEFYAAVGDTYWHPILDFSNWRAKVYDAAQPPPRVPVADVVQDIGIPTASNPVFPEEVAAVLSFHSLYISGSRPARHRGRVYLGPLSDNVMTTDTGERSRLDTTFIAAVGLAVGVMTDALPAGTSHAQHSHTDSAWRPVVGYWMDNALDTQRRRGPDATVRVPIDPFS